MINETDTKKSLIVAILTQINIQGIISKLWQWAALITISGHQTQTSRTQLKIEIQYFKRGRHNHPVVRIRIGHKLLMKSIRKLQNNIFMPIFTAFYMFVNYNSLSHQSDFRQFLAEYTFSDQWVHWDKLIYFLTLTFNQIRLFGIFEVFRLKWVNEFVPKNAVEITNFILVP